jgi:hypothetical protein
MVIYLYLNQSGNLANIVADIKKKKRNGNKKMGQRQDR